MTTNVILGVDFLIQNKAVINFNDNTIFLDSKEYELSPARDYTDFDSIFDEKTGIMKIETDKAMKTVEMAIEDYKKNNPEIGTIKKFTHKIHYNSAEIVSVKPYKVPIHIKEATKKEIHKLLKMNIIQKSESPFNSPALPIYKRNGTVRLEIDYRKINANTTPEAYPFPDARDMVLELGGSTIFSQLDLSMDYYQILMDADRRKYTAFSIW